jgi:hypothetical protein
MSSSNTLTINTLELKRILATYGVSEKKIDEIISSMEKEHRHISVIQFIVLLEKAGLPRDIVIRVFRRMDMNDGEIEEALNMADESKINAEVGRLYNATVDFS